MRSERLDRRFLIMSENLVQILAITRLVRVCIVCLSPLFDVVIQHSFIVRTTHDFSPGIWSLVESGAPRWELSYKIQFAKIGIKEFFHTCWLVNERRWKTSNLGNNQISWEINVEWYKKPKWRACSQNYVAARKNYDNCQPSVRKYESRK